MTITKERMEYEEYRASVLKQLRQSPRAKALETRVSKAKRGDIGAGLAIIRNASEAISRLLSTDKINDVDRVSLQFVLDAFTAFAGGVPLARAMCVERDGSGSDKKDPFAAAIERGMMTKFFNDTLLHRPDAGKMEAYKATAAHFQVNVSTVRKAVKECANDC